MFITIFNHSFIPRLLKSHEYSSYVNLAIDLGDVLLQIPFVEPWGPRQMQRIAYDLSKKIPGCKSENHTQIWGNCFSGPTCESSAVKLRSLGDFLVGLTQPHHSDSLTVWHIPCQPFWVRYSCISCILILDHPTEFLQRRFYTFFAISMGTWRQFWQTMKIPWINHWNFDLLGANSDIETMIYFQIFRQRRFAKWFQAARRLGSCQGAVQRAELIHPEGSLAPPVLSATIKQ